MRLRIKRKQKTNGRHVATQTMIELSPLDRAIMATMLADAVETQLSEQLACHNCDHSPGFICGRHSHNIATVNAYRDLAQRLGVTGEEYR